jgi:hypothetical protein
MYNYLLENGDKLKKLTITQSVDLEDLIYMRKACLPHMVAWNHIKSMVVTEQGSTLWQLSEKYLNSQESRAIGQIESPVTFLRWITQK